MVSGQLREERPAGLYYTLIPPEWLFPEKEPRPVRRELGLGDRHLVLEVDASGHVSVGRLISTDPSDYLNPRWQPGAPWPSGLV